MSTDTDNLERLNANLAEYIKYTSKSVGEAVARKGADITFALARRLKVEAPSKDSIRSQRLAAFKSGGGIHIRESVRNKITKGNRRINRQALMVKRELALRERGRGFLAYGARINTRKLADTMAGHVDHRGRYQQRLGAATLKFSTDGSSMLVEYGSARSELGTVLAQGRFRKHINAALGEVADDIQVYLDRKLEEANR